MSEGPKDGVIKFKFNLKMAQAVDEQTYLDLEKWRIILFKMNFIGEYPKEKVGFGNISKRLGGDSFLITGSQTGKYQNLNGRHYTKVMKGDLAKMSIEAQGPIAPSSESLTHFAIYHSCPQVKYIFHIHSPKLWRHMLDKNFPKTKKDTPYGTIQMAQEVKSITSKNPSGIIVMEGHEDGIISYGETAEEAGKIILETLKISRQ